MGRKGAAMKVADVICQKCGRVVPGRGHRARRYCDRCRVATRKAIGREATRKWRAALRHRDNAGGANPQPEGGAPVKRAAPPEPLKPEPVYDNRGRFIGWRVWRGGEGLSPVGGGGSSLKHDQRGAIPGEKVTQRRGRVIENSLKGYGV